MKPMKASKKHNTHTHAGQWSCKFGLPVKSASKYCHWNRPLSIRELLFLLNRAVFTSIIIYNLKGFQFVWGIYD